VGAAVAAPKMISEAENERRVAIAVKIAVKRSIEEVDALREENKQLKAKLSAATSDGATAVQADGDDKVRDPCCTPLFDIDFGDRPGELRSGNYVKLVFLQPEATLRAAMQETTPLQFKLSLVEAGSHAPIDESMPPCLTIKTAGETNDGDHLYAIRGGFHAIQCFRITRVPRRGMEVRIAIGPAEDDNKRMATG
jgi:hypothetical protein